MWPNRNASYGQSQVLVALGQTTLLDKTKTKQLNPYGLNDLTFSAIGKGKKKSSLYKELCEVSHRHFISAGLLC